jgi:hypothetical protein
VTASQAPQSISVRATTGYNEGGFGDGPYGGGDDSGEGDPLSATRTLSSTEISPSGTITVTLEATAQSDALTFRDQFSPAVESATVQRVAVEGTEITNPTLGSADSNGAIVTVSSVQAGDTVTATYTVSVADDASVGNTIEISGQVTSGDQTDVPLAIDTLTIAEGSPLDPPVAQYDTDQDGSITIVELGGAASDYASGEISITTLGQVASVYASS